jgi:hypothetical protein
LQAKNRSPLPLHTKPSTVISTCANAGAATPLCRNSHFTVFHRPGGRLSGHDRRFNFITSSPVSVLLTATVMSGGCRDLSPPSESNASPLTAAPEWLPPPPLLLSLPLLSLVLLLSPQSNTRVPKLKPVYDPGGDGGEDGDDGDGEGGVGGEDGEEEEGEGGSFAVLTSLLLLLTSLPFLVPPLTWRDRRWAA